MSTHEPDRLPPGSDDALRHLAQDAEFQARPGDPTEVRRLGQRRRVRRRQRAGAVVGVVVLLAGGGLLLGQLDTSTAPPPVAPSVAAPSAVPSPAPTAARAVDRNHTVQAVDLPPPEPEGSWTDASPTGRATVCQPEDWESLGATSVAVNGLQRRIPAAGETEQPIGQAVALQLSDPQAAEAAAETIRGWIDACPERLSSQAAQVLDDPVIWTQAPTEVGSASFATVAHAPAAVDIETEGAFWESIGVTVVEDRVAVTVDVVGLQTEYYTSLEPGVDDPSGAGPHPQFDLTGAAALRLDDQ